MEEMDVEEQVTDDVQPVATVEIEQERIVLQDEINAMIDEAEAEVDVDVDVEQEEELAEIQMEKPVRYWPEVGTARAARFKHQLNEIKEVFHDQVEEDDMTMVSEYANEIFDYMNELEVSLSSHTLPQLPSDRILL